MWHGQMQNRSLYYSKTPTFRPRPPSHCKYSAAKLDTTSTHSHAAFLKLQSMLSRRLLNDSRPATLELVPRQNVEASMHMTGPAAFPIRLHAPPTLTHDAPPRPVHMVRTR